MPSAQSRRPPVANFDSATAMLRALARFLHGKSFPALGTGNSAALPLLELINHMPRALKEQTYSWSGWAEAIPASKLKDVRSEPIARWITSQYPPRRYPAIAIGSSNGALVNFAAAMGIPWLPQTLLIPVRRHGIDSDEPRQDMHWGRHHAHDLLANNPDLQLHHMHDANQDRLMIRHMTYFRVKWLSLPQAYQQFIRDHLEPGGTLFIIDCQLAWPTTTIDDRHFFQHGALGGLTIQEFFKGSERAAEYLHRQRPDRDLDRWDAPEPDTDRPEAEWGFEPTLGQHIQNLAQQHQYNLRRIAFEHPEDFSPLVADLYQWWYQHRGIQARRLVGESFLLTEPYWMLRTASTPYWMFFNKQPSLERLTHFLDQRDDFHEIYLMLFCHGVESAGLVSAQQWLNIINRAPRGGRLLGIHPDQYPRDFSTYVRYHTDFKKIPARYPMPGFLTANQLDTFLEQHAQQYPVHWTHHAAQPPTPRRAASQAHASP